MEHKPKLRDVFAPILRFPWLTVGVILLCMHRTFSFMDEAMTTDIIMDRYWLMSAREIWDGAYWGLLGPAFMQYGLQNDLWLMIFNLFAFWALASRVESTLGRQTLIATVFFSALIGSGAQLAIQGTIVPGLSAVVCALFGLMLTVRNRFPMFTAFLSPQLAMFIFLWILLHIMIGLESPYANANAGLLGGLLFGIFFANVLIEHSPWRKASIAGLILLALVPTIAVLQPRWLPEYRVYQLHQNLPRQALIIEWDEIRKDLDDNEDPSPHVLNLAAWFLATANHPTLRDGERAIDLAMEACAKSRWTAPGYIDTLAAAYAEVGDWEKAEYYSKKAVAEFSRQYDTTLQFVDIQRNLESNLESIRNKKPIRTSAGEFLLAD